MGGKVLPIIPLSCLRAGGGRVTAHLGEPRGCWWSSCCSKKKNKQMLNLSFYGSVSTIPWTLFRWHRSYLVKKMGMVVQM
ncbi:hypothetical protein Hanom_Chr13g01226791 [Helianthus anomalus]